MTGTCAPPGTGKHQRPGEDRTRGLEPVIGCMPCVGLGSALGSLVEVSTERKAEIPLPRPQ